MAGLSQHTREAEGRAGQKETARDREREASCSLQFGVSIYRLPFKHLKGRCQKHGRG